MLSYHADDVIKLTHQLLALNAPFNLFPLQLPRVAIQEANISKALKRRIFKEVEKSEDL